MKKSIFVLALLAWCLVACTEEKPPANLVEKEKMGLILKDLHVAEKRIIMFNFNYDSAKVVFHEVFKPRILEKHGVTKADFDSSFYWYESNIKEFSSVYDIVLDSLTSEQSRIQIREHRSKAEIDSLSAEE